MVSRSVAARIAPARNAPRIASSPIFWATATNPTSSTIAIRTRISAVVSCSRVSSALTPIDMFSRDSPSATAATSSTSPPTSTSLTAMPLPLSEKKNDSSRIAPKSATDAAATTSWPRSRSSWPASFRIGTTRPSEVADSATASRNGLRTYPAAWKASPAITPIPTLIRKPVPASRSSGPRSRFRSSSAPARKSRNASPSSASTPIGVSNFTQPSTDGPTTMPATMATTSAGIRARGARLTSSGAASAISATTSSPPNDTLVISRSSARPALVPRDELPSSLRARTAGSPAGSQPVLLEQPQPHLTDGGERRHGMPEPVQRHLAGDRDRRRVQQLGHPRPGERRTHQHPAGLVHDQLAGAGDPVAQRVGARHVAGRRPYHPNSHPGRPGLGLGRPHRADLRVGERHPRHDPVVGHVDRIPAQDHVGGQPTLVLAHVGQQRPAIAVPDRVQPPAGHADRPAPVVDRHKPARRQPDRGQAKVRCGRLSADRDQDLVGDDLPAGVQRGQHRPVATVPAGRGQQRPGVHGHALGLERAADLGAGERLLPREQPVRALDHGHLPDPQPPARLRHLQPDRAAAEHQQPARQVLHGGDVPVVPRPQLAQPRHRRDHRAGAGGQHHRTPGLQQQHRPVRPGHLHPALAGQPTMTPHQLDAAILQPTQLAAVPPAAGHVVPLGERGGDVQRAGDRLGRARHPAGRGQRVAGPDQRLARDAAPVRALPADELPLHQHHRQAAVGAAAGDDLTGRPGTDHHHIRLAHAHRTTSQTLARCPVRPPTRRWRYICNAVNAVTPTAIVLTPASCRPDSRSRNTRKAATAASAANWEASTEATAIPCRAPRPNAASPSTSPTPAATTSGPAARVSRSRPDAASGTARAATPISRAGSSTQATGSTALARPAAYRLSPNSSAAPAANGTPRPTPDRPPAGSRPAAAASSTPTTMPTRASAGPVPIRSPANAAVTAATAPSVDTIGATTLTLPTRRPR